MNSKHLWSALVILFALLIYGTVSMGDDLALGTNQTSDDPCWLEGPLIVTDSWTMYNLLFSGSISVVGNKYYLKYNHCPFTPGEKLCCYPAGTRVIYLPEGKEPPPPEPPQPEPPQPKPEPQPPDDVTPPKTTHQLSCNNPHEIKVTLTATDDTSGVGVAYTKFSMDNGATWQQGTEFWANLTLTDKILYYSEDNAGNREIEKRIVIKHLSDPKVFSSSIWTYGAARGLRKEEGYKITVTVDYSKIDNVVSIDKIEVELELSSGINGYHLDVPVIEIDGMAKSTFGGWSNDKYYSVYVDNIGVIDCDRPTQKYSVKVYLEADARDSKERILSPKGVAIPLLPGGVIGAVGGQRVKIFTVEIPLLSQSRSISGMILPYESTSDHVSIDSTVSEATFNLSWQGSDLDLVLYTPDAIKIDATTAWDDPDIYYVEGDTYEYYTVRNPVPGDWIMEIIAVDVPPDGEEYIAVAYVSPDLNLDAKINITEEFSGSDSDIFDLSYKAIMFSPVGDGASYRACIRNINELSTDPTGGQAISLSDDGYEYISLAGQRTVSICSSIFAGFYVGSNGYITFSEGYIDNSKLLADHFDTPRVSCLFNDFDPSSSGTVSIKQLNDRVVVTWEQIPQYDIGGSSTFQVEMYFDGTIQLAWLEVSVLDGIVGLSDGQGLRSSFEETDLSELGSTPYVYDIVIGDFENNMDNWVAAWEGSPVLAYSTTGVTLGRKSLSVNLGGGGYWALQWNAPMVPRLQPGTTLQFDVTMIQSEWTQNNWTQVANKIAISSDGPSRWKEYSPIAIDRITGQSTSLDWGPWNPDALKTYSVDISSYDATGATWFQINISLQQNPVNGAGYFYIDNVQLLGLKP